MDVGFALCCEALKFDQEGGVMRVPCAVMRLLFDSDALQSGCKVVHGEDQLPGTHDWTGCVNLFRIACCALQPFLQCAKTLLIFRQHLCVRSMFSWVARDSPHGFCRGARCIEIGTKFFGSDQRLADFLLWR